MIKNNFETFTAGQILKEKSECNCDNNINLRTFTAEDIDTGLRLSQAINWNQQRGDWELFYNLRPEGCFAAIIQDKIIGTVATVDYQGITSWISMVLVDSEHRRKGIASMLLDAAINSLSNCACIKLDATPAGKKVYDRLGFVDSFTLKRMTCQTPIPGFPEEPQVRQLTPDDFSIITGLDAKAFGVSRPAVIKGLREMAAQYALVYIGDDAKIQGFTLGRPGNNFEQIGPIVAQSPAIFMSLIKAAMSAAKGRTIGIDFCCYENREQLLSDLGFIEQRSFIRMVLNKDVAPENLELLYAISGPELG